MTVGLTPEVWACLGDSQTSNTPSSGAGNRHPWPARVDVEIFPERAAANLGVGNYVMSQITTRYEDYVVGKGYYGIVLWGGVNDLLADRTGAAVFADIKSIVDDALERGMKVIVVTQPPCSSYSLWSGARQTQLEDLVDRLRDTFVDGYHEHFVALADFYDLAADPDDPTELHEDYEMSNPDGLHQGVGMQDEVILPTLVPLMEAEEEEAPAESTVRTFGVTYTTVRQDHFPQWSGEFSATSNPTSTTVTRWIQEAAAELAGVLRLKASSANAVYALGDSAEPYLWCRQTVTLGAAARVAKVIAGGTPEYATDLQRMFEARLKRLEEKGVEVMGPGISVDDDTDEPQGPTSHVDDLDLDVGEDDDNESQLVPVLRRDDMM